MYVVKLRERRQQPKTIEHQAEARFGGQPPIPRCSLGAGVKDGWYLASESAGNLVGFPPEIPQKNFAEFFAGGWAIK
jgi:hypothetical protein